MKKKLSDIFGIACVGCILAACMVTNEDGDPFFTNYLLLGLGVVLGFLSRRTCHEGGR